MFIYPRFAHFIYLTDRYTRMFLPLLDGRPLLHSTETEENHLLHENEFGRYFSFAET